MFTEPDHDAVKRPGIGDCRRGSADMARPSRWEKPEFFAAVLFVSRLAGC
jgi:hypothetical protein